MTLSADESKLLRRELRSAELALAQARKAPEPLEALTFMTNAIETMTATQHELVNALLDRGASWSTIADALSTSSAGAQRRYPRRPARASSAPGKAAR